MQKRDYFDKLTHTSSSHSPIIYLLCHSSCTLLLQSRLISSTHILPILSFILSLARLSKSKRPYMCNDVRIDALLEDASDFIDISSVRGFEQVLLLHRHHVPQRLHHFCQRLLPTFENNNATSPLQGIFQNINKGLERVWRSK